jgi:hypothetical protein
MTIDKIWERVVYSSLDGGHAAPKADGERQDTAGKPSSTYGLDPRPPIFYSTTLISGTIAAILGTFDAVFNTSCTA